VHVVPVALAVHDREAIARRPTGEPAPMEGRSRWIALYVLCTGMLMVILDGTIVNVALPSIQDDLGFKQASLAWVVNAYLIAFAVSCCSRGAWEISSRAGASS